MKPAQQMDLFSTVLHAYSAEHAVRMYNSDLYAVVANEPS